MNSEDRETAHGPIHTHSTHALEDDDELLAALSNVRVDCFFGYLH